MKLKVLGSSSNGNCYLLEGEKTGLILEAGIPFKSILKSVGNAFGKYCGVLVSHAHLDHSKSVKDFIHHGVSVYSENQTFKLLNVSNILAKPVKHGSLYNIGDFSVIPFQLKHDIDCLGYLIKHEEMGVLMFATDTYYIPNKFSGLNHILIEANYDTEILNMNLKNKIVKHFVRKRIIASHMSLDSTIEFLKSNDLSKTKSIVLLHLSDKNSDSQMFKKRVASETGIPTHIAEKGLELNLIKSWEKIMATN